MNKGTAARSLRELYRQKSDEELLAMWSGRSNFTDIARQALENILVERHLPIAAITSSAPPQEETPKAANDLGGQPESGGRLGKDEIVVQRFSDTVDLSRAISRLEDAGIEFRVHDHTDRESVALGNARQMELWLIVKLEDKDRVHPLVRDAMGLEDTSGAANPFTTVQDLTLLGYFPREDALVIARALAAAGLSYLWSDPKDDPEADAADDVGIEVRGASLERAQEIAESSLSTHG